MLKTGMIIAERYEIVSKIGTGGMADVYKAMDHKLNRFVAVKVLKPEFREDATFVKKFRSEAQAAAGLTHPNIVNVFDVGDDEGVYYIVMELIEGITLKEYISKKGKLSVKEATSIAIQVSMGLEAAHSHGIVHRDVKPQNIIISTDGKVKVTDFGIARAASSNTISSNVMGSVHYSSPEQVRGGYSDEKSDIYSLGITLYEMVTGRVPFDGDTTVAIAIKHLQEEMVPPSVYSPDLPYSLEQIIMKCTQKSVDRRYNKMEDVIEDLKHSLIDPQGDFVKLTSVDTDAKTVVISDEELGEIKHIIDKRCQTGGLVDNNLYIFRCVLAWNVTHNLTVTGNHCQRRPQVMRNIGNQIPLKIFHLCQFMSGIVQRFSQFPDFLVALSLKPHLIIPLGQPLSRLINADNGLTDFF